MNTLTEIEKAYIAGFVDGEGCISISKWQGKSNRTPVYSLNVIVSQVGLNSLATLENQTGIGTIHEESGRSGRFSWRINPLESVDFLNAILPYLRNLKSQAEVALEFQKSFGRQRLAGRGYSVEPEIVAQKEAFYQRLHDLKGTSGLRGRPKKEASV